MSKRGVIFNSLFDSQSDSLYRLLSILRDSLQQTLHFQLSKSQQFIHFSPSTPTDAWVPPIIIFFLLPHPPNRSLFPSTPSRRPSAPLPRCDAARRGEDSRGARRRPAKRRRWRPCCCSLSLCTPKSGRAAVFLSSAAPPPSLAGCGTSASRRPLPPGRSLAGARPLQPAGPSSAAAEEGRCSRFDLPRRRFWSVDLADMAGRVHGGRGGARGTGGRERVGQEGGRGRG